jgi:O-antigen/teichoic acid export membrane protein
MNGATRDDSSAHTLSPLNRTEPAAIDGETTRKHIRGSGLLLGGRMISLGLNLVTQVIIARYLSKDDFGRFAYALAAVSLGSNIVSLGLDKSAKRFVAIYHEGRDFARLFGTILLSIATILALGLVLFLAVIGFQDGLANYVVGDQASVSLLMILIALAPMEALNRLCEGLAASFAGARAIFFRLHLLGPALRLTVIGLLAAADGTVYVLATGYLLTGVFGAAAYFAYLMHLFRKMGLWRDLRAQRAVVPAREIYGFSLPLLSTDAATAARRFLAVFALGFFYGPATVAMFRVVIPLARLNSVVFETFHHLYVPLAARLFARHDHDRINHLYWLSALWITVLSFPVFLVTMVLAEPFTVLLVGEQYRESASVLAWLSLGLFFNAILGFNTLTLKIFGDVRNIVRNDMLATAAAVALYFAVIPSYGALGAAVANCACLVFHNLLNQVSLLRISGVTFFPPRYFSLYAAMLALTGLLYGVQLIWAPPIYVGLVLVAAASGLVLMYARETLEVEATFPELGRWPVVRRLFGFSNAIS